MHELYSQVSIKDEKYDPFNWNTIGSLILMCGGGLVIKPAGAGVITLETAIGIMAGGGAAVGGGTELANQVQSGEAINPGAIATRTAFGGVKGALWGLAPELGAVGFGASIGGYSAVENLTYNATKGKTTASDSIEAIAGGLGEGIFAGIMHKASSKAASKASESVPAKPEPIKPMTEAELERVSGGAKDPGWRPTGGAAKAASKVWDYSKRFTGELKNFNPGYEIKTSVEHDLYLVQYHSGEKVGDSRSLRFWTTTSEANRIGTVNDYLNNMALLQEWGPRDYVTIAKIPAGTKIKYAMGTAKEQLNPPEIRPGGGRQLLFENFDESWIIETRKLP